VGAHAALLPRAPRRLALFGLAPRSISMAKTPQTKGGYTRVDGLDVEDESFEGDSVASIQAHWRK
jgi:hypothetical protein